MVSTYEKYVASADAENNDIVARTPPARAWVSCVLLAVLGTLLALSTLRQLVFIHSYTPAPGLCPRPAVRQEWRTLSSAQKSAYISGVQCLQRLPGISYLPGAKTRFDDFQALHVARTDEVHLLGQFLPWHRRMLGVYETALREECGYPGAIPYWDWRRDVDAGVPLAQSPIFDPTYGFGGNGADVPGYAGQFGNLSHLATAGWVPPESGGGCVLDGPFAAYNLSVGPGTQLGSHCLQRALNDALARGFVSSTRVAAVMTQRTFEAFRVELEGGSVTAGMRIHDGGHNAIGGEMADSYSSPGDPLFYLHHAFLDKLWWEWEAQDLGTRLRDVSGRSTADPPYVDVTLDFELGMLMLAPMVAIRDVMDIRNDLLCYTYE